MHFIVGAKVLNKDMTRKKRVVDTCFVGPYVITKCLGKVFRELLILIKKISGAHRLYLTKITVYLIHVHV